MFGFQRYAANGNSLSMLEALYISRWNFHSLAHTRIPILMDLRISVRVVVYSVYKRNYKKQYSITWWSPATYFALLVHSSKHLHSLRMYSTAVNLGLDMSSLSSFIKDVQKVDKYYEPWLVLLTAMSLTLQHLMISALMLLLMFSVAAADLFVVAAAGISAADVVAGGGTVAAEGALHVVGEETENMEALVAGFGLVAQLDKASSLGVRDTDNMDMADSDMDTE